MSLQPRTLPQAGASALAEAPTPAPASAADAAGAGAEILVKVDAQGIVVRDLKSAKGDPAAIKEAVTTLLELKAAYKAVTGADVPAAKKPKKAAKDKQKQGGKLELKTPKGMRDYTPQEMTIRESVFKRIIEVFKLHGAVSIETPVMELKVRGGDARTHARRERALPHSPTTQPYHHTAYRTHDVARSVSPCMSHPS